MAKLGLDQTTAWIGAVVLAGTVFGIGYGIARLSGGGHGHGGHGQEEHAEHASAGHGEEAAKAESAHGSDAGHKAEGGKDDAHAKGSASKDAHDSGHAPKKDGHGQEAPSGAKDKASGDHERPSREQPHGDGHGALSDKATDLAQASTPWEYRGSNGPEHWGELSANYALCRAGKKQSPVDIGRTGDGSKLLPLRFNYPQADMRLAYDGKVLSLVPLQRGLSLDLEGERYDLRRIDLHAPSEHRINGLAYDLELQLLHQQNAKSTAILALLVDGGKRHPVIERLVEKMPVAGDGVVLDNFDLQALLPDRASYYRYDGSLSKPPCAEGVTWLVMVKPIEAQVRQIDALAGMLGYNARPLQSLHGRVVLKSAR